MDLRDELISEPELLLDIEDPETDLRFEECLIKAGLAKVLLDGSSKSRAGTTRFDSRTC